MTDVPMGNTLDPMTVKTMVGEMVGPMGKGKVAMLGGMRE